MRILADIDVASFRVRAYYTPKKKVIIPTNEAERVVAMQSGMIDTKDLNEELKTRKNIFSILSTKEQERLEKFAEPIGMSGWRGTMQVQVSEKKLLELMQSE